MHPNAAFRTDDGQTLLDRAEKIGIAHIFAATPDGPMVAHAPVTRAGEAIRFHIARGNRITPHLDGARVLLSIVGTHGYISPNWYARPGDQVPTWNYLSVEIEGLARAIGEAALIDQLDRLAAVHEPRVNPADPWTRDKMADAPFRKMLGGIIGFEVTIDAVRGTTKLSQNKPAEDIAGVVAGLAASDNAALAGVIAR